MGVMLLVKASVVWTVSLALARLLAASPAVARHRLWTLAFSCVLTLPLLGYVLPGLRFHCRCNRRRSKRRQRCRGSHGLLGMGVTVFGGVRWRKRCAPMPWRLSVLGNS